MQRFPVIVGFGGVNAAGRSSGHHGYRRTVVDALDDARAAAMWRGLAGLTGGDPAAVDELAARSLVRRIEGSAFDPEAAPWNRPVRMRSTNGPVSFELAKRDLPEHLPPGWRVEKTDGRRVRVVIEDECEFLVPDCRQLGVGAAGQLPTGFEPATLYAERSHPRALHLAIFGVSDALQSLGIKWQKVLEHVSPDQISTYAGSALTQPDHNGMGGLLASRYRGRRITSKQLVLGLGEMAADFANAYVLGSVGQTGHNVGACATFHYNLRLGAQDIREGRSRVAVVGGVETPLVTDVMDGLTTMGALATDASLRDIEGIGPEETPDHRRACRPFGVNSGFVAGEGAQFLVLMDDALALEIGADVHGGVGDVFVHADGNKKSISSPGVGNYLTFAKAVASARRALGDEAVRRRSFVHAHGTGTPQNRVTESAILDAVARAFEIEEWPVASVKCFVGHTMAAAGGDQIVSALGTWTDGLVPGVTTIDEVADDVHADRLRISNRHLERGADAFDIAFVNAKGFGGNNATAWIAAPHVTRARLAERHGEKAMSAWSERVEAAREHAAAYDEKASRGELEVIYNFDHEVRDDRHVRVERDRVVIEGYGAVEL